MSDLMNGVRGGVQRTAVPSDEIDAGPGRSWPSAEEWSGTMSSVDVEVLARRAAAGDSQAFEAVCRALQDDIWRYCRALLGDRELAFEAAQDTFVRAVTGIRRFRGEAPVRVWLLVIARRACADLMAKDRRRLDRSTPAEVPEVPVGDATGHVDLQQLVNGLPEDLAQAFVLTQMLGLSYAQTAQVAACRIGTVRSRVFRARQRLVAAVQHDQPEEDRGAS